MNAKQNKKQEIKRFFNSMFSGSNVFFNFFCVSELPLLKICSRRNSSLVTFWGATLFLVRMEDILFIKAGLSMNGMQSHSHLPTHDSIYLGMLLLHVQNFIWQVNHMQHFNKCVQLSFCKYFFCNFMLNKISIYRNPLYCIVFRSKHTGLSNAQKHFKWV